MTTATLLVIDIQEEYFPGGVLPLHEAQKVEERLVAAIRRAQAAGERVVLVQHVSPAQTGLFAAGSRGAEIRQAILSAAPAAPVVRKQFADAFQDTDLSRHLDGVTQLRICGMMTQNCVVFTAMTALASGYDVTVIGDLCTAPMEVVHRIALNALRSKMTVRDAEEVWPAA